MSINKKIDTYRKRHRRCRTCKYAKTVNSGLNWFCATKNATHVGHLTNTGIKGCFCKLYSPLMHETFEYK